jgi:collagenase-like PrtC family protease
MINGIQIQSAARCNLMDRIAELQELGVDVLRISPDGYNTAKVLEVFREVVDLNMPGQQGLEELAALAPDGWCNGFWQGGPGREFQ